jgi:predicted dithiol-disulfide oxidoreductase (DUF899 family)
MSDHVTRTREEWLAARLELLDAEKELTRRSDELARRRQQLPWVRIDKDYRFDTDEGSASLADLFRGRSQLLMYHFMFGPEYNAACPVCSTIADGFNGFVVHLENHDVAMMAVSRAPIAAIQAYKRRMGWSFPWASSLGSDFNFDFAVSFTEEQQRRGSVDYNFRSGSTDSSMPFLRSKMHPRTRSARSSASRLSRSASSSSRSATSCAATTGGSTSMHERSLRATRRSRSILPETQLEAVFASRSRLCGSVDRGCL